MLTSKRMLWGGLGLVLATLLLTQLLYASSHGHLYPKVTRLSQPTSKQTSPQAPININNLNDDGTWTYTPARDANNPGLNSAQCDAAFPDLYAEIQRSVAVWRDHRNSKIRPQDTDVSWRKNGALRLLIHDNELRVLETRHTAEFYRTRTRAVLLQLNRALEGATVAGWKLPTVEFSVVVDDQSLIPGKENPDITCWTFARRDVDWEGNREWLMPDFNFWHTPASGEWKDATRKAKAMDNHFEDKIPQAVWRGAVWTLPEVREKLIAATRNKTWADVEEVNWDQGTNLMRAEDFCRYAFVVHTEGRSWSGRLKYLLDCDSVPIVHELGWLAHYYHTLVPEGEAQNFVQVKRDMSDLEEKVLYYLEHPQEAQRIADNAVRAFRERYTTVAAEACYWRKLVEGWSEVAWIPEPTETVTVNLTGRGGGEIQEERMRGMPFGAFILSDDNYP